MFSVIFDMDGTLLDSQRIHIPAWDYAGDKQGFENMGRHIATVCGMNEVGWTGYLESNFPSLDILKFKTDVKSYLAENDTTKLKSGAKELLCFLKENNIKMAVASGSSTRRVKQKLQEVDVLHYFNAVVGGEMVTNGKPEPDIFLYTAKLIGAENENCFVFEDSVNGIMAAHNAGMKCFGIPDVVCFDDDIKSLLFAPCTTLADAIPVLKEFCTGN